MRLGLAEIVLIALIVVLFVNPKDLPGLFRKAGRLFHHVKSMRDAFTQEMRDLETTVRKSMDPADGATRSEERRDEEKPGSRDSQAQAE